MVTNCKVLLTGCFSVGKTSLFNKFLYQKFDEKYHTTIGVKVDKKIVAVDGEEVAIMLWDLVGETTQNKIPKPYFLGAQFILYVIDLSTPFTWQNLSSDLDLLQQIAPKATIKIIGNKKDLLDAQTLENVLSEIPHPLAFTTSAKTGENIDHLFKQIANELLYQTNVLS
jgi:small GTP-binding protein